MLHLFMSFFSNFERKKLKLKKKVFIIARCKKITNNLYFCRYCAVRNICCGEMEGCPQSTSQEQPRRINKANKRNSALSRPSDCVCVYVSRFDLKQFFFLLSFFFFYHFFSASLMKQLFIIFSKK